MAQCMRTLVDLVDSSSVAAMLTSAELSYSDDIKIADEKITGMQQPDS